MVFNKCMVKDSCGQWPHYIGRKASLAIRVLFRKRRSDTTAFWINVFTREKQNTPQREVPTRIRYRNPLKTPTTALPASIFHGINRNMGHLSQKFDYVPEKIQSSGKTNFVWGFSLYGLHVLLCKYRISRICFAVCQTFSFRTKNS